MFSSILVFTVAAAAVCALAAALLRMQPIGAEPGLANRFAGLLIGHGFRLTRRWRLTGDRQLVAATIVAWFVWSLLGGATIALIAPGYDPGRMWLVYGLLCGALGAVIGFAIAFLASAYYAKATNMSTFEGAAGYFVVFMGLIGSGVGAAGLGIAMTLFFHRQGH